MYIKESRPKFLKQDPSLKQTEIVRKASKAWAELDPVEKESFQMEYNKNHEAYVQEMERYNNSITDEQRQLWEEKKKEHSTSVKVSDTKRKSEAFGKPKRPSSAFLTYLAEKKNEKDANTPFSEWVKSVTKSWNEMSNTEKKSYVDRATESMVQYRKQLDEWETKMINLGHTDIVRQKTLTKQKSVKSEQ